MIWFNGPGLPETLKKIDAWFPKRNFPLLLGTGVPVGVLEFDGGIWSLYGLEISENGPAVAPVWRWLKRGALVVQTNSKSSLVDALKWWWGKYIDSAPESAYLSQIGYDSDEKWLEFTAMVPRNQHLTLGDLRTIYGFLRDGTSAGERVESVRVTFHSRSAARRELPWLIHLGVVAQFFAEDGSWQVLGKEALSEPVVEEDSRTSPEFEVMLQAVLSCDSLEIEGLRDEFSAALISDAVIAYAELSSWRQKASMVQLVQDIRTEKTRPLMTDFLKAPRDDRDDEIWIAKAIALWHLTGDASLIDEGPDAAENAARAYLAKSV